MSHAARGGPSGRPRAQAVLPRQLARIAPWLAGNADTCPRPERGQLSSSTISEAPTWRLGLARLGPDTAIPLHDHPGAYAVSLVLSGRVAVDTYSLASDSGRGTARLSPAASLQLGPGETALLDPWQVNVHRLRASAAGTVLLTGTFSSAAELTARRWFFPLRSNADHTLEVAVVDDAMMRLAVPRSRPGSGSLTIGE